MSKILARLVPSAPGMRIAGAATSAAKMNCRTGSRPVSRIWLYVPGEGFVRWSEVEKQVAEAYVNWRVKMSLAGVRILDGWEWRQDQITAAMVRKSAAMVARRRWLRGWAMKHAELERRAAA